MTALQEVLVLPAGTGRAADHAAEAAALHALARELEDPQGDVLAILGRVAMDLCGAGSAGVSVLEPGPDAAVFRWYGATGAWSVFEGESLPANASPCGIVVRDDRTLLFRHPERYFPAIVGEPRITEALLAPFRMLGEPVGTVWVLLHDKGRHFDAEHVRLMESLAGFAGHAFMVRSEIRMANDLRDEALRRGDRLARALQRLQGGQSDDV